MGNSHQEGALRYLVPRRLSEHQKYVDSWPVGLSLRGLGTLLYLLLGSRYWISIGIEGGWEHITESRVYGFNSKCK